MTRRPPPKSPKSPRSTKSTKPPKPRRPAARGPSRTATGRPERPAGPPKARRGLGGDQVEGRQAVRELLIAGRRRVREVLVAGDADDASGTLADIVELATGLRVPLRRVGAGKLAAQARSEAPQGVIAFAAPLEEVDLDRLAHRADATTAPFLIALDGVTDPGNLGAVLRTAEGVGVTGVVLPRHRAVNITPTVAKAAAGAIEHLPIALVGGLPSALSRLRELGVWTVGLDMGGEPIDRLTLADEPVALVLGAEGRGLSRLVRDRCDVVAAIPIRGRLDSLNVAAAGAIACWEIARRRHPSAG